MMESHLPRAASLTRATSLARRSALRNAVTGTASLVSLSIMSAMPMPQFGMAAAGELAPVAVGSVDEVGPVGEGGHEGDGEPVAGGLAEAGLVLDVVREVREGVALRLAALVGDVFVAAGEADRLEGEEVDLLRVVERELDDAANLLVVDAVDDGGDGDDVDAGLVQVVDGLELHVERVADLAVRVGGVADAVELQVGVAETGFSGGLGELLGLGELDAVGRGLHGVVTDLAGVGDGVEEVGGERGLAAGELDAHLTRGLMVTALSSMVLISSQVSSWTKPTWLASMKQGSHIMLQRLVRSMVRTEPRPWVTVEVPWLWSFSSLWARMSRPGKTSSRCLKKAGSMDMTSSKWPWMGQSLTIRIWPSRSMICALISPTFSLSRISWGSLPSTICWRISGMHLGQRESVVRGQPRGGFSFW